MTPDGSQGSVETRSSPAGALRSAWGRLPEDVRVWVCGGAAAVAALAIRWQAVIRSPLGFDEATYAVIARKVQAGYLMYGEVGATRPPVTYWPYWFDAWLSEVTGLDYAKLLHVSAAALVSATVGIFFAGVAKRFARPAVWAGTAVLAVTTAALAVESGSNSESWMFLPYTAAGLIVLSLMGGAGPATKREKRLSFAAGAMVAVAAMTKQVAAVGVLLPVAALLAEGGWRRWLTLGARCWGGAAAVLAAFLAWAGWSGQLSEFVAFEFGPVSSTYINQPLVYSAGQIAAMRLQTLWAPVLVPVAVSLGLAVAALALGGSRERRAPVVFGLAWLALSLVGVSSGGRYFEHYFMQVLPAVALLVTAGLDAIIRAGRPRRVAMVVGAVAVALAVATSGWSLYRVTVERPSRYRLLARRAGQRLASLTGPRDRVLAWNTLLPALVYADREPSSVTVAYYSMENLYHPQADQGGPADLTVLGVPLVNQAHKLLAEWGRELPDAIVVPVPIEDTRHYTGVHAPDHSEVTARLERMIHRYYYLADSGKVWGLEYAIYLRDR